MRPQSSFRVGDESSSGGIHYLMRIAVSVVDLVATANRRLDLVDTTGSKSTDENGNCFIV